MDGLIAARAAKLASTRPQPLEFDDEQTQLLTGALFDAQIAALRAIAAELGRAPGSEVRRNVIAYSTIFGQLRGAAGQLAHGAGWFGYPTFDGEAIEELSFDEHGEDT